MVDLLQPPMVQILVALTLSICLFISKLTHIHSIVPLGSWGWTVLLRLLLEPLRKELALSFLDDLSSTLEDRPRRVTLVNSFGVGVRNFEVLEF